MTIKPCSSTRWALRALTAVLALSSAAGLGSGTAWAESGAVGVAAVDPIADVVSKVSPSVVRIISVRPPKSEDTKVASSSGTTNSGTTNSGTTNSGSTSPATSANSATPTGSKAADDSNSDRTSTAIGSGFIIDPSGFIATNKHVVEGATSIFVMTSDGVRYQASMVGMPSKADMALIHIHADHPFPAIPFGDSDKMKPGDTVIAIGSPFGFDNSVTAGIVSAVDRDIMESPFDDYIQTDAAINHGNSGGPLFNLQGEVIGMNSVIFSPSTGSSGLGFALPSNEMKFVFGRLMETGVVRAGMLPIHTQQVTWMLHQALSTPDLQGALVSSIHDSGDTMLRGKIKAGDVIMTFNGEKVVDPRDLARKAAQATIGSDAVLTICRNGQHEIVNVTIQEWPEGKPIALDNSGQKELGLQLTSAKADDGHPVVTVAAVDPTGTAADSGIQKGDIIVEVQETPVSDPGQAFRMFSEQASQQHHFAAVLVDRDKKFTWMPLALPKQGG